jgi:tetratricopeptide (TPR) repeat protein
MRKIFEQLQAALRQFLTQRDYLLLLVPCEDTDVPLLLKALRDLDRELGSDMFLLFAEAFRSPGQYLEDIAQSLQEELRLTNSSAGPDTPELPPLPDEFLDGMILPPVRLEAGLGYGHSLVDPRRGQHFLWGMGPEKIEDPIQYLELLAQLPPRPDIRPWMRGARIVARVPADFELQRSPLARAKRVQVRPFSIPPNIMEEELLEASANPNVPPDEKMRAELQLAYLDCAYSRFDQAIARFLKALAFFQWAEVPVMEGLVIAGLGDVARRQENWHDAQHWYECAVVPAAKSGNPMLMSNIVQNLAVVAFHDKRFADAEQRYSELVALKRGMIDEDGLVEALEWQGLSEEEQLAYDRAVVCWEEGALICRAFELKHRLPTLVGHLKRGYQALEMHEELETFDAEWALEG